ncbi:hypothetical protein ACWZHB_01140 [Nocardia sp. FBN12]|uniref:hypothetical protein n=1 Tax=Nocardia sp. FBN12 TaxID=3419766 RepID=UPI003D03D901
MSTNKLIKVASVIAFGSLFTVTGVSHADAQPQFTQDHHVVCFTMAIGPGKSGPSARAPISFGYKVNCNTAPTSRHIEYVLHRKNLGTGRNEIQAFGRTYETTAVMEETFFSECSGETLYEFWTEVNHMAEHGNTDSDQVFSDHVLLAC